MTSVVSKFVKGKKEFGTKKRSAKCSLTL